VRRSLQAAIARQSGNTTRIAAVTMDRNLQ
jgi:hypothetical protein